MTRKEIAEAIQSERNAQGLTSYALAKKAGLQISQITMLEQGEKNYTIDILSNCLTGLGLSIKIEKIEES